MPVTCPLCNNDVTETGVRMEFCGATLLVYHCFACPKMEEHASCTFVVLPENVKMHPDDVAVYLNARRGGAPKEEALKKVKVLA